MRQAVCRDGASACVRVRAHACVRICVKSERERERARARVYVCGLPGCVVLSPFSLSATHTRARVHTAGESLHCLARRSTTRSPAVGGVSAR